MSPAEKRPPAESDGQTPAESDGQTEDPSTAPASQDPAPAPKRGGVKTTRQRAEEKRLEKLEGVQQQLENGSLVIRKMTEEERRKYPVRPAPPPRGRR